MDMLVCSARHVVPIAGPPIESGAVAVAEGRIVAVGRTADVLRSIGGSPAVRDLGDAVLLPGLVNAHTHLELSWCIAPLPGGAEFSAWVRSLIAARNGVSLEAAKEAAEEAVRFVAARGTLAVGDLSNDGWIAPLVARSRLHGMLFRELLGFRAADAGRILDDANADLVHARSDPDVYAAGDRVRLAPTPHAIYSTSPALLTAIARRVEASNTPLSIHVAESEAESELVMHGRGPFADLLRDLGVWDAGWRAPGTSPVEALDRLGVLSPRTLAVHCVQVSARDLELLRLRGVTVVTCPRSNAHLGTGKAPVPAMLAAGIPVAIGTDSLASAPDLDLFSEMAALRAEHPGLAPDAVLRMATLHGARALGLDRELGSLVPGKRAELLCVRLQDPGADPLEALTDRPTQVEWV